jgi:hypothetical protein
LKTYSISFFKLKSNETRRIKDQKLDQRSPAEWNLKASH